LEGLAGIALLPGLIVLARVVRLALSTARVSWLWLDRLRGIALQRRSGRLAPPPEEAIQKAH
jgi:hypothetical protein